MTDRHDHKYDAQYRPDRMLALVILGCGIAFVFLGAVWAYAHWRF